MDKYITKKEIGLITLLVLIDQFIKILIDVNLQYKEQIQIFLKLYINKIYNYGVSFSFLSGKKILIIVIVFLALIYLVYLKKEIDDKISNIAVDLIIAGGVGNLIDRLIYGYVIDYIQVDLFNFPIFNLADILVFIGFVVLIIRILFYTNKESS